MKHNLGQTNLRRKRIKGNSMDIFDGLPISLRQWMSKAVLPWSPSSAHKLWKKLMSKGLSKDDTLRYFSKAESQTLSKEKRQKL